jgi:hypothetical protein
MGRNHLSLYGGHEEGHLGEIITVATRTRRGVANDHIAVVVLPDNETIVIYKMTDFKNTRSGDVLAPFPPPGVGSSARRFSRERLSLATVPPPSLEGMDDYRIPMAAYSLGQRYKLPVFAPLGGATDPPARDVDLDARRIVYYPRGWRPIIR